MRFCVIDQDRHCGPVEIGSTSVTLKVVTMMVMMTLLVVMMTMMVMMVVVVMMVMMMMMMTMVMMIITMITGSEADRARPGQVLLLPDPQPSKKGQTLLQPPKKLKFIPNPS